MKTLTRLACLVVAVLAACTSTSIVSTWKKPGLTTLSFQNVVVVAHVKDPEIRKMAEDRLVGRLKVPTTASYTLNPEGAPDEQLKAVVETGGFDGAIVMRVVSVEKEAVWVPGAWSSPYYGRGGFQMYDPGYVKEDTSVRVETNVYKVRGDAVELVWAAASKTVNPRGLNQIIDETVDAVAAELRKQGLVTPPVAINE